MIRSTFFGLNLGYKGLAAQQQALDVVGHNISNAKTEGYSRERAVMVTDRPMETPQGFVGTGVQVINIERIRDQFLDQQMRKEINTKADWEMKQNTLSKIESIMDEPSDSALRNVMDKYWTAWEDLSKNPESTATRTALAQRGEAVAETLNHLSGQLADLKQDLNDTLKSEVNDINSIAKQIAALNFQIIRSEANGKMANDFRDTRDLLVEELSKRVDLNVNEDSRGALNVYVGGKSLVYVNSVIEMKTSPRQEGIDDLKWEDNSPVKLKSGKLKGLLTSRDEIINKYSEDLDKVAKGLAESTNFANETGYGLNGQNDTGTPFFTIKGESVGSQAKAESSLAWNDVSPTMMSLYKNEELNGVSMEFTNSPTATDSAEFTYDPLTKKITIDAKWENTDYSEQELQDKINDFLKDNGYENEVRFNMGTAESKDIVDGTNFKLAGGKPPSAEFTATNISMNADILEDVSKIAAAENPVDDLENGEGDNKNALRISKLKYDETIIEDTSIDDYYRGSIADLGIESKEAQNTLKNRELLVNQISNQRQLVMGVSTDEEMTNMIQFQHAYSSSARFITTVDEMLDIVINRLGRVGL